MKPKKAIIIGAGVAGLASAIRLAVKGFSVAVFERNIYPGGKLSWFEQDGFSFDAGPSLFTQPQFINELFTIANRNIIDYLQYERVPVSCTYFFDNEKKVIAYADRTAFAKSMHTSLGEDEENIKSYLNNSALAYKNVGAFFLNHSLHKWKTYFNPSVFKALRYSKPAYLLQTLNSYNNQQFKSNEASQIFNRYATYNGSNPYKAPAMLSMIPHLELNEGTFYPKGGMISITNALFKLAKDVGVQFYFDSKVDTITHHNRRVNGIVCKQENYRADVVVSNSDVYFTYKHLLHDENKAKHVLKQERSSSALIFYWGVNHNFSQLGLHNIFFSSNYQQEFAEIFNGKNLYDDPTVYVNITSKMEGGQAPVGMENWFVMINASANKNQDWQALQKIAKENIIRKLNKVLKIDIAPLIVTEAILDPVTIETKTQSYMGSLYGTSSNSKLAAFFRHANFSNKYKGLFFVGGSVHPGGGIPLCLKSAEIMSNFI